MKHTINLPFTYDVRAFASPVDTLGVYISHSEMRYLSDFHALNFTAECLLDYHLPSGQIPQDIFMLREEQYKEEAMKFITEMFKSVGLENPLTEYYIEHPEGISPDSDLGHAYQSFALALDLIRFNANADEELRDLQELLPYLEDDGMFMLSFYHCGWEKYSVPLIMRLHMWKNNLISHQHDYYESYRGFMIPRKYLLDDPNVHEVYKPLVEKIETGLHNFYKTCIYFEYCIDMRINWVRERYEKIKKAKK